MIKIVCLGKIKENYYKDAIDEYLKRIRKYTKIEIIELKDEIDTNVKEALEKESEAIIKALDNKDNLVVLDIMGKTYNSCEFADFIDKELTYNSNITFLIGSSNGFSDKIKKLTNKKVSFSNLTFPHQLFRVILLEQIYRSYRIINNEKYHK